MLPDHDELLTPRPGLRVVIGAGVLGAVLVGAHLLSAGERAAGVVAAWRGAGLAGIGLHLIAYLGVSLLGLPVSPLTVLAGATYGPLAGTALAVPAITVGACAAFLVGRFIARNPDALARGEGRVARAARTVGRGGLRLVLLLRLSPVVPFSVLNFGFGASPTRFSSFALGSFLGSIPSQLGYAILGGVLAWPAGTERTQAKIALFIAGALLTVCACAGIVALVRRRRQLRAPARG